MFVMIHRAADSARTEGRCADGRRKQGATRGRDKLGDVFLPRHDKMKELRVSCYNRGGDRERMARVILLEVQYGA